ncbi:ABC-type transport auxiliary lipoprotein family protein [Phenylobacterium kunshanense]|uniref:ABC transporter n=1 Tax=Phenylobacterium kunshanense TaxID=1445034 RepID=A0A328BB92_9CAUL|nr:ABC-type transport auxiliary lipoprotein family protein [Phenylobacterium kunshanense]RAK63096.1 ABC transporter [Phenylobacterium kunshanense]
MIRPKSSLAAVAVAAAALALSGCISLLPKTKPAHLYRFGHPPTAEAAEATQGTVGVFRTNATFQREAAGDRLLTITGGKVAYIAETRWVAPAAVLWDQAVLAAFDADPGPVRLISRGEAAAADYVLRLDVRNFEAVYDRGPKAAPTVVVRVRAAMTRGTDRGQVAEKIFEARVTAGSNRVGAIVPAYDKAVADTLAQIVAWTTEQARPA